MCTRAALRLRFALRWGQLISKNYEIELACQQLEGEVAHLNQQIA